MKNKIINNVAQSQLTKKMISQRDGYTLIELLVVVLIIGILVTAAQVNFVRSMDNNLIVRANDVAFTAMKLAKHLSIIENTDYIFAMYNADASGAAALPSSANWKYAQIIVYKSVTPFYPDGYTEFQNASFATAVVPSVYVESKFKYRLPEGSTVDAVDAYGDGTPANPWRTIFKYYGPCQGLDTSRLGKYNICTHKRRYGEGVTATSANASKFYCVMAAGGNFAGAPVMTKIGQF